MNEATTDEAAAVVGIAGFLFARLAEDEAALKWTSSRGAWEAHRRYASGQRGLVRHVPTGDVLGDFVYPADAEHAVRWQPSRALAEIEAKRAVVGLIFGYEATIDGEWGCCHSTAEIRAGKCPGTLVDEIEALRVLALPYAGHPDYDPAWAPGAPVLAAPGGAG